MITLWREGGRGKTRSKSHISDIFFLHQIHFDGIEIGAVDNWESLLHRSTRKENKC